MKKIIFLLFTLLLSVTMFAQNVISTFPWLEDFSNTTFPPNTHAPAIWNTINVSTPANGQWKRVNANQSGGPTVYDGAFAYRQDVNGQNQETYLVTPAISIPATGKYELEFMSFIGYPQYCYPGQSSVRISHTVNNNWTAFTTIYALSGAEVAAKWQKISISLSAYAGQTFYLAFVYKGGYDHNWGIDNVTILPISSTFTLSFDATPQPNPASMTVTDGTAIGTLPNPAPPAGHTFGGWFIGSTQITATTVWNYTSNQTATAVWNPIDYTLNLNAAPGTVTPTSVTVHYDSLVGSLPTPSAPAGYTFGGWFIGATQITAGTIWKYTSNQTATAVWNPKTYILTFDPTPGTLAPPLTKTVTYDAAIGTLPIPIYPGYGLIGWLIAPEDTLKATDIWKYDGNQTATAIWVAGGYTLFLDANGGTVTPDQVSVFFGMPINGLPTPIRSGYTFNGWLIGTSPIANGSIWNHMTDKTAVAQWEPSTYRLYLDPSTGTCGTPYITVTYGSPITTLPNATQPNCTFLGWFIGATQITAGYVWNTPNDETAIARFNYPIVATNNTPTLGTITPSGTTNYSLGQSADYTCTPNSNAYIVSVVVDGTPVFNGNSEISAPYTHTFNNINTNHNISAVFALNTYTITPSAGANGTITPDTEQTVVHGSSKTFNFYPADGYKIEQVFIDGDVNVLAAEMGYYTFVDVVGNHTIHVTFTKQIYTITSAAGPHGTITPLGVEYVAYFDHSEVYVFTPEPGYHIKEVLVDGNNNVLAVTNGTHRFMNVTANHTLSVFFAKDNFIITATAMPGGTINPSGVVVVPNGNNRDFFFSPDAGYALKHLIVDDIEITDPAILASGVYTFYEVSEDHTISVQFTRNSYDVSLPVLTNALIIPVDGSVSPVNYGGKYAFEIVLLEGYTQSKITVRANDKILNPVAGVYTILNITQDQIVTIDGITLNSYKVEAKTTNGGEIIPAGIFMVPHGDSKTFEIVPNFGYIINDVKVNGKSEGAVKFFTLNNVTSDVTIIAYFEWDLNIDEHTGIITVFSTRNVVTIENKDLVPVKQVEIMDMYGRVVWTGIATGTETKITLDVATGVYAVRIITEDYAMATTKVTITN